MLEKYCNTLKQDWKIDRKRAVFLLHRAGLRRIRMGMREFYAGKSSVMNCFSTGDACDRIEK